jgi:hypothetical protein
MFLWTFSVAGKKKKKKKEERGGKNLTNACHLTYIASLIYIQ